MPVCVKMFFVSFFVLGIPMLIVVASLVITRTENYAADNCWLAVDRWLIYWAFVGPLGVVVTVSYQCSPRGTFVWLFIQYCFAQLKSLPVSANLVHGTFSRQRVRPRETGLFLVN